MKKSLKVFLPFQHIIKQISKRFNNYKLREKTMIAFLCVSLIPLLFLGSFCFLETRRLLTTQAESALEASLKQTALSINSELATYNQVSRALCYDKALATAAGTWYDSYYSMFEQLNYTIDESFLTAANLKSGIEGITLYTGTNLPKHGKTVSPIGAAEALPWYPYTESLVSTLWYPVENSFYCIQPMLYPQLSNPHRNLIVMKISDEFLLAPIKALQTPNTEILITDKNGLVIYDSLNPGTHAGAPISPVYAKWKESRIIEEDDSIHTLRKYRPSIQGKAYTLLETALPAAEWSMLLYVPYGQLGQSSQLIFFTVFFIILLCLVLVYLASRLFSRKIVYRIEALRENMTTVANGKLEVTVTSDSSDEIGEMIQDFDKMVGRIDSLILDNYESELKRKQAEMNALQAQINPHFLYNSLSLINWRAIRIHASDISEMAQLLSNFYRTTLNRGKHTIPIADELLNVESYTKIQLIMHSDSFDVEYDIDKALLECTMPNLMLQPLMENAILHGIENKEEGRGIIKISCKMDENDILFILNDNGIGIPEDTLPLLLLKNSDSYGIRNVHDRARILYGEPYGLTLRSTYGKGTSAELRIPIVSGLPSE